MFSRGEIFKFINPIHRIIPDICIMQSSISASDTLLNYYENRITNALFLIECCVKLLLYKNKINKSSQKNKLRRFAKRIFDYRESASEKKTLRFEIVRGG